MTGCPFSNKIEESRGIGGKQLGNLETDLHEPIKQWLIDEGCEVRSEVKSIDMVGLYGDLMIAVELKLKLNLEVINQAVERQGVADLVYIAVMHDYKAVASKRFQMTLLTLKRLQLGLLLVNFRSIVPEVVEYLKPENFDFEKSKRARKTKRAAIIAEFNKRAADFNTAGSTKSKIMTSYKEQCLLVAYYMKHYELESAKAFKPFGFETVKVSNILVKNFNRWYHKVEKGKYVLSEEGEKALETYSNIIAFLLDEKGANHENR